MNKPENPLRSESPAEIHLDNAPLVRVIGQIQFPGIESINDGKFVAPFQEEIRDDFPILGTERLEGFRLTHGSPVEAAPPRTIWRFVTQDNNWRLSLASDFIALETTKYSNRSDFISKLKKAYGVLINTFKVPLVNRVGLRYIARVKAPEMSDIEELVRPEVFGMLSMPLFSDAKLALQDNIFKLHDIDGEIRARWGIVPANASIDPSAIEAIPEQTWIFDLDVSSSPEKNFSEEEIAVHLTTFAEKSYSLFRWAVTDEFLRRYGGDV